MGDRMMGFADEITRYLEIYLLAVKAHSWLRGAQFRHCQRIVTCIF